MFTILLDLLFPKRSLTGSEGSWITDSERKNMRLAPTLLQKPELMKRGMQSIDAVIAAGDYDKSPLLRKAILAFKFKRVETLDAELGVSMSKALHGLLLLPKDFQDIQPVLCPVPLHWTRRFQRGFNQAELLSKVIGAEKNWPTAALLSRIRATGHQAKRQRAERLTALKGAFTYTGVQPTPRFVILVDDICTTGATLDECATMLKEVGVEYVAAVVAALG